MAKQVHATQLQLDEYTKIFDELRENLQKKTSAAMAFESKASEFEKDLDILCKNLNTWDYKSCECKVAHIPLVKEILEKSKRYKMGPRAQNVVEKLRLRERD